MSDSAKHPLMTSSEVAAAFRVDMKTVARWRKTGKIASTAMPSDRNFRFFRAEIEALLRGKPLTPEELAAAREQALGGLR